MTKCRFDATMKSVLTNIKVILEGINSDAFEELNSLIVEMYNKKGIDENTILDRLKPEDYPIMDDAMAMLRYSIEMERRTKPKLNTNIKGGI